LHCALVEVGQEELQDEESDQKEEENLEALAHDRPEPGSLVVFKPVEPSA
jgi:hypothetical protein